MPGNRDTVGDKIYTPDKLKFSIHRCDRCHYQMIFRIMHNNSSKKDSYEGMRLALRANLQLQLINVSLEACATGVMGDILYLSGTTTFLDEIMPLAPLT